MNCRVNPWPLLFNEALPLTLQQREARANRDVHAAPAALFHQGLVHERLVTLQHGEWIQAIVSRNVADGGQRVTFLEDLLKDHRHDPISDLAVDRLTVVPVGVHGGLVAAFGRIHRGGRACY